MLHTTGDFASHQLPRMSDEERIILLQDVMDAVTRQIAEDPLAITEATDNELKRFQTQTRIIAGQIRSYEKLIVLKKSLLTSDAPTTPAPRLDAHLSGTQPEQQTARIAAGTGTPHSANEPSQKKNPDTAPEPAVPFQSERRRVEREARKALRQAEKISAAQTPAKKNPENTIASAIASVTAPPESQNTLSTA